MKIRIEILNRRKKMGEKINKKYEEEIINLGRWESVVSFYNIILNDNQIHVIIPAQECVFLGESIDQLKSRTDSKDVTIYYEYDILGRLKKTLYQGSEYVQYTYDNNRSEMGSAKWGQTRLRRELPGRVWPLFADPGFAAGSMTPWIE